MVSATNRPLEKDVEGGRFRADLLARLGHVIAIPPLRERPDDVPLLVEHFLARYDRGRKRFADEALAHAPRVTPGPSTCASCSRWWSATVCLVDHDVIVPEDLPEYLRRETEAGAAGAVGSPGARRPRCARSSRRRSAAHILRALEYTRGNRRKAIELLSISPETFYRRLEEFGIKKKNEE